MNVADTLDFLAGSWHVQRTFYDCRVSASGQFDGSAIFAADDSAKDTLRFEEVGEMNWDGYRGTSRRRLHIVRARESGVRMSFLDGHHFIDLDLRSGHSFARHGCRDDLYEVTTIATSDAAIEERWRVKGPLKDYVALSTWTRVETVGLEREVLVRTNDDL